MYISQVECWHMCDTLVHISPCDEGVQVFPIFLCVHVLVRVHVWPRFLFIVMPSIACSCLCTSTYVYIYVCVRPKICQYTSLSLCSCYVGLNRYYFSKVVPSAWGASKYNQTCNKKPAWQGNALKIDRVAYVPRTKAKCT
jgi:hypothetical protein